MAALHEELMELVDWWVPHVEQWNTPGVPEALRSIRASRRQSRSGPAGREFHASVYDNGVPITEAPWERTRFQALDVWASNGTLDGTLSWYLLRSILVQQPVRFKLGGRPVLSAQLNVETAGSERKRPEI
jgi:hypothetical protein